MRILVTRPEPDAGVLAKRLAGLGHEPLVEPLIVTRFEPLDDLDLDGVQALVATSRNAVRAIGLKRDIEQVQSVPIYVVGPGTAAAARAIGFRHVVEGPKAARELIALIALDADVNGGPLMHLTGDTKAVDLAGELRHLGFHVLEPQVYRMEPAAALRPSTAEAIAGGWIDAVLLFSPATARTWVRLVTAQHVEAAARRIRHLCLSQAVATAVAQLGPGDVACAVQPNLEQMLALVARTAPQSR